MTKPTAFIIDDEPGIAQLALDVATDCGYNAQIVTSGVALDAAADVCDVIVLDLLMPGMDGVEVLRGLAAAGSRAQIILMSGMDRRMLESARKVAAMQNLSVAGVLNKPFRPAELRNMLTGIIATTTNAVDKKVRPPQVVVTVEDLARAIAHDELVMHYQPKLNLADQRWIGVEALVRWQHPVHGLLYPDAFVHIAEGGELALPFTYEVARKAVADCAVMIATMGFEGSLAINIPPSALTEATVPERLLEIIAGSVLEPSRLVVEITETSIPTGLALSLDIQTRLRMRGIRLSIDDFGTGHSSLERLHETPFDELKIDMMFVRGAEHNPALRLIAESAVTLGHSLGMVVVAEGVENAEALVWLTQIGCDSAQGYHISRPVPLSALGQWAKLQVADVAQPPVARTKNADAPALAAPALGKRVLVVDDEQALCELACDWLESLGYQPTGVHSPAAALERLAGEPFDILFTDIVMPGGMDGLALARRAKAEHPALQILLTSGYAQGLTDTPDLPGTLISKPYRKNDLARVFAL